MKKIEVIGQSEYFNQFVNRTDIEILQLDIKGCEQSSTFQESLIAVIYYVELEKQPFENQVKLMTNIESEMREKAIKAFKDNCQHPTDTEGCDCKLCVRYVGKECSLLNGFIQKLDKS